MLDHDDIVYAGDLWPFLIRRIPTTPAGASWIQLSPFMQETWLVIEMDSFGRDSRVSLELAAGDYSVAELKPCNRSQWKQQWLPWLYSFDLPSIARGGLNSIIDLQLVFYGNREATPALTFISCWLQIADTIHGPYQLTGALETMQ